MSVYSPSYSSFTNPCKFLVYRNSAQNTGNAAFAIINFDTKVYDTGSNVDIVSNVGRFTAPINGFYRFNANANITTANKDFLMSLWKNGADYAYGTRGESAANQGSAISILLQLLAGDYVEINTFCSGTAALDVGASPIKTWFNGSLVSAT